MAREQTENDLNGKRLLFTTSAHSKPHPTCILGVRPISSFRLGRGASCRTRSAGATLTNSKKVLPSHTQHLALSGTGMIVVVQSNDVVPSA